MAISVVSTGTWPTGVQSGTLTVTVPAHVAGDLLVAFIPFKHLSAVHSFPSGWTYLGNASSANGAGYGADAGDVSMSAFYQVATSSGTTLAFTITGGSTANTGNNVSATCHVYRTTNTGWRTPLWWAGPQNASSTSWGANVTMVAGDLASGDVLAGCVATTADAPNLTNPGVVVTGMTYDPATLGAKYASAVGADMGATTWTRVVTGANSGTAATLSANLSTATYGVMSMVRVREIPPVPTVTSLSTDQAASGSTITITGTLLDEATVVRFGDTPASFVIDSATQITATVPAIPPSIAEDDFERANGSLGTTSVGAKPYFATTRGTWAVENGKARVTAPAADNQNAAHIDLGTGEQAVEVELETVPNAGAGFGIILRAIDNLNYVIVAARVGTNPYYNECYAWVNNSTSAYNPLARIQDFGQWASGDIMRAEIHGSNVWVYRNQVRLGIIPLSHSSPVGGTRAGMYAYSVDFDLSTARYDNLKAWRTHDVYVENVIGESPNSGNDFAILRPTGANFVHTVTDSTGLVDSADSTATTQPHALLGSRHARPGNMQPGNAALSPVPKQPQAFTATFDDARGLEDTSTRTVTSARTLDSDRGLSDLTSSALLFARTQDTARGLSDAPSFQLVYSLVRDSSAGLSDPAPTRAGVFSRTSDSSAGLVDAVVFAQTLTEELQDDLGRSDAATGVSVYVRVLNASAGLVDTVSPQLIVNATLLSTTGLVDTSSSASVFARTLTTNHGLSDLASLAQVSARTLDSLRGLVDVSSSASVYARSLNTDRGLSDATVRAAVYALLRDSTLAQTDQLLAALGYGKVLSSDTSLTDFARRATKGPLPPDAIVSATNVPGPVSYIQDDPYSPDGFDLVATAGWVLRVSFPNPGAMLLLGAGEQRFRVRAT